MNGSRVVALVGLAVLILLAGAALLRPGAGYAAQDREAIDAGSSRAHPAGTDALGRDRATRVAAAMLLGLGGAVAAAAVTTAIAAAVGTAAAFSPPLVASGLMLISDAFLTLPWLFLLMIVRGGMSLTASPMHSAAVTFAILAALGWPACARAVFRGARRLRGPGSHSQGAMLQGRAAGLRPTQLIRLHVLPALGPLLLPQFLVCIPAFLVAEANLGTLGLGIAEPLPSWGGLLLEADNSALLARSAWVLLPVVLLAVVLLLLETLSRERTGKPLQ